MPAGLFCFTMPAIGGQVTLSPTDVFGGYLGGYHAYGPVGLGTPIYGWYWQDETIGYYNHPYAFVTFDLPEVDLAEVESARLDLSATVSVSGEGWYYAQVCVWLLRDGIYHDDYVEGPRPLGLDYVSTTVSGSWEFHVGQWDTCTFSPAGHEYGVTGLPGSDGLLEFRVGGSGSQSWGPLDGSIQNLSASCTVDHASLTLTMIPEPGAMSLLGFGVAGMVLRRRRHLPRVLQEGSQ